MIRRSFLAGAVALAGAVTLPVLPATAKTSPKPFPLPSELQAGDLLWPKVPGAIVPYYRNGPANLAADYGEWTAERKARMAALRLRPDAYSQAQLGALEAMSYYQFRARYLEGYEPGRLTPYSFGGIAAVGHVAIVTMDKNGVPGIIEAYSPKGVVPSTYADWITAHPGEICWQGRLKGITSADGDKFAAAALKYKRRPYDFWNFDLSDANGFYCSKLVWLALMQSLNIAIDGNTNPKRLFWLSPKQELYAKTVDILLDQGNYTNA